MGTTHPTTLCHIPEGSNLLHQSHIHSNDHKSYFSQVFKIMWVSVSRYWPSNPLTDSSRLVTTLKFIYFSTQDSNSCVLTVCFMLTESVFQTFPLFIPDYSFSAGPLIWHCKLTWFLGSKNFVHSSSSHGLYCFNLQ
jgi:hypothetical protein